MNASAGGPAMMRRCVAGRFCRRFAGHGVDPLPFKSAPTSRQRRDLTTVTRVGFSDLKTAKNPANNRCFQAETRQKVAKKRHKVGPLTPREGSSGLTQLRFFGDQKFFIACTTARF